MTAISPRRAALATMLLASVLGGAAHAQRAEEEPGYDGLLKLVGDKLPPVIGTDNSELVRALLSVELGKPIRESFDYNKARAALFGRIIPIRSPDCLRTTTPVNEPDQGDCTAYSGSENGGETYRALSYSKRLGLGNIRFLYRPKATDLVPADLKPVQMSSAQAYEKATSFLGTAFGLPLNELPPTNAERLPVKDLTIGFDDKTGVPPVVIQKVVMLRRGLKLPTPFVDPETKRTLTHVPAPGMARVALDANGNVVNAVVSNWLELRRDAARIDPKNAKSRDELVQEIARDLANDGGGAVGIIAILIGLSAENRGDYGYLLPAVQVFVNPGGRDTEPPGPTTGGIVREYSLVGFKEGAADR